MSDAIICPECQTAHYASENYCESCGADLGAANAAPEEDPFAFDEEAPEASDAYQDEAPDEDFELAEIPVEPIDEEDDFGYDLVESSEVDQPPAPPVDDIEEFPEVAVEPHIADDALMGDPAEELAEISALDVEPIDNDPLYAGAEEPLGDVPDMLAEDPDVELEQTPPVKLEPQRTTPRAHTEVQPLPSPGVFEEPALLTLYRDQKALETYAVELDALLIGRGDQEAEHTPDIDLSEHVGDAIARRQIAIYRQNKNYIVCNLAASGTQFNDELLNPGDRRRLNEGDTLVLGEQVALRFSMPAA